MKYITTIDGKEFTISINNQGEIEVDGEALTIDFHNLPDTSLYSLIVDGQSYDIDITAGEETYHVMVKGTLYEAQVEDERTRRLAGLRGGLAEKVGEILIKAPMPGVIVKVLVHEGQAVAKNEVMLILESMKMQNEFKAPQAGIISSVRIKPGDKVDQNAIMVTLSA